jgi:hypothetical protein
MPGKRGDIVSDLVQRLSEPQPIEVSLRPERSPARFKAELDRGFVHLRFVNTRGGTEFGVRLNSERCDLTGADWQEENGQVSIVGELVLDYVQVRCHATIHVATLAGTGHLEPS